MKKLHTYSISLIAFLCSILSDFACAEPFDPIVVYLTWMRDPHCTMTIRWITRPERTADIIEYHADGDTEWQIAKGTHVALPNATPYLIHQVTLSSLKPSTDYFFRPGVDGVTFKFHTMPRVLNTPVRFVSGGDVYRDDLEAVKEMNRIAASTNPHFAIVGGDIAYSIMNGNFIHRLISREKFDRWLDWLKTWKSLMVTTDGCLIPILPVIGNHETMGGEDQRSDKAVFFYALFPMPGKQGYNVLDFGNYLSVFLLDSGHTNFIHGDQTRWLEQTLKQRQDIPNKFAVYHVGAYPSVRPDNSKYSRLIRRQWVPLFDEYGLSAAFEHHDHAYKRTHPLTDGKVNQKGVVYIGDGCWGIRTPRVPKTPAELWYLAKSMSCRHVISVTLDVRFRKYKVITHEGRTVDEFVQYVE